MEPPVEWVSESVEWMRLTRFLCSSSIFGNKIRVVELFSVIKNWNLYISRILIFLKILWKEKFLKILKLFQNSIKSSLKKISLVTPIEFVLAYFSIQMAIFKTVRSMKVRHHRNHKILKLNKFKVILCVINFLLVNFSHIETHNLDTFLLSFLIIIKNS